MSSTDLSSEYAFSARNLVKTFYRGTRESFSAVEAVRGASVYARPGETVAVVGPRGAGKSSLLLCLAGLLRPDEGALEWWGAPQLPTCRPKGVVYIPQEAAYYQFLTVRETLDYALLIRDIPIDERDDVISCVLARVGLSSRANTRISTLSRNSYRRMSLAYALLGRPRALLVDETLSDLDESAAADLGAVIRSLAAEGVTVVIATQDMSTVQLVNARTVLMSAGRIVGEYPATESVSTGTTYSRRRERLRVAERVRAVDPVKGGI
jgi:ABC-type multidrug transport system ATPase subunit